MGHERERAFKGRSNAKQCKNGGNGAPLVEGVYASPFELFE